MISKKTKAYLLNFLDAVAITLWTAFVVRLIVLIYLKDYFTDGFANALIFLFLFVSIFRLYGIDQVEYNLITAFMSTLILYKRVHPLVFTNIFEITADAKTIFMFAGGVVLVKTIQIFRLGLQRQNEIKKENLKCWFMFFTIIISISNTTHKSSVVCALSHCVTLNSTHPRFPQMS